MQISLVSGLTGVVVIVFMIALNPGIATTVPTWRQVVPAIIGGVLNFCAGYFYYKAVKKEEVTRIAPLYSFSPIFAIILAGVFLGEKIAPIHILGILIIVAGGILVDSRVVKHMFRVNWVVMALVITSSVASVAGSVGFKMSYESIGFQSALVWFFAGAVMTSLVILLVSRNRKQFMRLFRTSRRRKLSAIMLFSNIVGNAGRVAHNYAILLVPIAFVQAVEAFESAFVLVLAILLMRFFRGLEPEDLSRRVLAQKALSIAVIVSGSLMLTL